MEGTWQVKGITVIRVKVYESLELPLINRLLRKRKMTTEYNLDNGNRRKKNRSAEAT